MIIAKWRGDNFWTNTQTYLKLSILMTQTESRAVTRNLLLGGHI